MTTTIESAVGSHDSDSFAARVRSAIVWRSGSQIAAQLIAWSATVFVIRLLAPADYGLMAMSTSIVALASLLNGYSFAGALVQSEALDERRVSQVFGMLIVMNFGLALAQVLIAPIAAAYFRTPLVAPMLRVQALLHLTTPFIIMPNALLSRQIDFRSQARVNLIAGPIAAATAITGALAGWGVWTLVAAPIVLLAVRAVGLLIVGRWWVWPSFRFAGAGMVFGFGGAMLASDLFWFVQSQADVFIAGRSLDAHRLGVYSTALFLAQILVNKFVPALNEVAFPSYARLSGSGGTIAPAFARAIRAIMLIALPWCIGMAAVADPLVRTVLGDRWLETVPVVRLLGLAMPFVVLHILFPPATNALGRPGVSARIAAAGAMIMGVAFLIGMRWGAVGLAASWLCAYPLLTLVAAALSLPVIGLSWRACGEALAPAFFPAAAMGIAVAALDQAIDLRSPGLRLLLLVVAGAIIYLGTICLFARATLSDAVAMIRRKPPLPVQAPVM